MHRISRLHLITAGILLLAAYWLPATAYSQSTGGLKGKVRSLRGDNVAGATVEARQGGKVIRSTTTNSKGDFVLDGLAEGVYNLAVDADGYSTGVMYNVEVKKKKMRDLGNRLMLSVDRGTQIFIRGVVFFKEMLSVYGATVELFAVSSDGGQRKVATGTTNDMGEFGFAQPGNIKKFRVKATFKGVSAEKEIETDSPAVYRTTLALNLSRSEQ